jgi:hypothetical protein
MPPVIKAFGAVGGDLSVAGGCGFDAPPEWTFIDQVVISRHG